MVLAGLLWHVYIAQMEGWA